MPELLRYRRHSRRGNYSWHGETLGPSSHFGPQPPKLDESEEQHVRRRSEELVYDVAVHDTIKEGNLGALVDHLTDPETSEPTFSDVFFLTYSTFTTASELFTALVERARETQFDERSQEVIRTRTIAALTSWFERYWGECNSPETTQELRRMHGQVQRCSEIMDNAASARLLAAMEQRLTGKEPTRRVVTPPFNTQPPSPITPKSMKKMKLAEIDPTELARQLTILESQLYRRIRHVDWLNKAWTTEAHTGINAMILHSNQLANWVVEVILGQCDMKRRVGMMKYFIQVAEVGTTVPADATRTRLTREEMSGIEQLCHPNVDYLRSGHNARLPAVPALEPGQSEGDGIVGESATSHV